MYPLPPPLEIQKRVKTPPEFGEPITAKSKQKIWLSPPPPQKKKWFLAIFGTFFLPISIKPQ